MKNNEFLQGMKADAEKFNRKFGRPAIEIDFDILENLCRMFCTLEEIAGCFSCSEDTIQRRIREEYDMTFAEYWKQFSAHGKMSLRRKQFESAMNGNTALLIYLGDKFLESPAKLEKPKDGKNDTDPNDISTMSEEEIEQELKDMEEND